MSSKATKKMMTGHVVGRGRKTRGKGIGDIMKLLAPMAKSALAPALNAALKKGVDLGTSFLDKKLTGGSYKLTGQGKKKNAPKPKNIDYRPLIL